MKKILITACGLATLGWFCIAQAGMESLNHRIDQSVISGGGTPVTSSSFKLHGTVGQSSPLAEPGNPPSSLNYELQPGFWPTIVGTSNACSADFDGDGDVDGQDLSSLVNGDFVLPVAEFSGQFGRLCE